MNNNLTGINNSDDKSEIKRIDIEKIRNEATEISKLIDKSNFDVNKLKIQYNSFFKAYPILFDNLISKKMTLEELNILLNTLANAQEHFFKSI
jgi:hypothetical protein